MRGSQYINVYAGNYKEEKDLIISNLAHVADLLDIQGYRGTTISALVRWLARKDPHLVASALMDLRAGDLQEQLQDIQSSIVTAKDTQ